MPELIRIYTTEYPPYPGGIATYVASIAEEITKRGTQVEVCVFCMDSAQQQSLERLTVRHLSNEKFSVRSLIPIAHQMSRIERLSPASVVICADVGTIIGGSAIRSSAKKVAVVHGSEVQGRILRTLSSVRVRPLARYKKIVANSDFTRRITLQSHDYLRRERILSAPLAVRKPALISQQKASAIFSELNIPSERKLLISVGRLEPRKGVHVAVNAIASLPPAVRSQVTYLIIGKPVDAAYTETIDDAIRTADADIRRLGAVSQEALEAIYRHAKVLLHTAVPEPRSVEGFGLVLLEAATRGLPVITTDVDAIPEVVIEGQTGLVVTPSNPQAVTDALTTLLADDGLWGALSTAALEHATHFSWARHVDALLS